MLDIAGWRSGRREELSELGRSTAKEVLEQGEAVRMRPMSPFERKIVHDDIAALDGDYTESEAENPKRGAVVDPNEPIAWRGGSQTPAGETAAGVEPR